MKYVCTGAILRCSMGTATCRLRATPKQVTLTGEDQANVDDYVSKVNVPGFGLCRSLKYPPTASATAAHHGRLTPMPCVPGTCPRWKTIDKYSLLCGEPALLQPSTLRCVFGGTISIVAPGQHKEIKVMAIAPVAEQTIDEIDQLSEEELVAQMQQDSEQLVNEPLDKQSVVEGLHTALDLAGFIPGLGAAPDILNAAIYAAEGNFGMASFSMLAAVPGIGDAAAAGKIAYKGAKIAQKARKVQNVQNVGKVQKIGNVQNVQNVGEAGKTGKVIPITAARSYSDNVLPLPPKTTTSGADVVKNGSGNVTKTQIYSVKIEKQSFGNGPDHKLVSVEKYEVVNDISKGPDNSISPVSKVQPIQGSSNFYNGQNPERNASYWETCKQRRRRIPRRQKEESLQEKLEKLDNGIKTEGEPPADGHLHLIG